MHFFSFIHLLNHTFQFLAIAFFLCGNLWGSELLDFSNRKALESKISDNGTVTLAWEKPESLEIKLEQSYSQDFGETFTRYKGTDPASVITGLPEGTHYFRISETGTPNWSAPLAVKVKFFPRWKLWLILSIGAVVVLATIAVIIIGHFTTKNEEANS